MSIINRKNLIIIITLFVFITSIFIVYWLFGKRFTRELPPQSSPLLIMSTTTPTTSSQVDTAVGIKTYTNTEYGFEFQYPDDLIIRENTFRSYYSKFNLQVEYWNKEGKYLSVFDINVVLPEFADRTFLNVKATTSTVIVDGMPSVKYEYEFESLPEVAVVLPLGQYRAILGIGGSSKFYGYENAFNQILTSFKFLK